MITSIKDERVVRARKGLLANERLVYGEEALRWAASGLCTIEGIFSPAPLDGFESPIWETSEGVLRKISETSYLIPAVGIVRLPDEQWRPDEMVVVLDRVKDFGNIGTIARTARAFGLSQLIAIGDSFDLYRRKSVDASRGAVFHCRCQHFETSEEAIIFLKDKGFRIVATTPRGSQLQGLAKMSAEPMAVVFGNETAGVSDELLSAADYRVQIPMSGMESLNVGVAAGISLYELKLKGVLAMLTQKIRHSLGRNLSVTARWMRRVFDHKLQEVTELDAEQAIAMMILQCEGTIDYEKLLKDIPSEAIQTLIDAGHVNHEKGVTLTPSGQEVLAKIWPIQELAEACALKDFAEDEREALSSYLNRIQTNCSEVTTYE